MTWRRHGEGIHDPWLLLPAVRSDRIHVGRGVLLISLIETHAPKTRESVMAGIPHSANVGMLVQMPAPVLDATLAELQLQQLRARAQQLGAGASTRIPSSCYITARTTLVLQ